MGMWKDEYISIGGYDEDFTGYAADDNDFTDRMLKNGCSYYYVDAVSVHLYHGLTCDAQPHEENPAWVYNQKLYNERKNIIVRNQGREWGKT
jgi:GT2 family glycosyltransferase